MEVRIDSKIHLVVGSKEFLLVTKALRGTLTESEKPKALALQIQLVRARHTQLLAAAHEAEKAYKNTIDAYPLDQCIGCGAKESETPEKTLFGGLCGKCDAADGAGAPPPHGTDERRLGRERGAAG